MDSRICSVIIVGSEVRLLFQPVAFWILLVALLKHGHDICHLPVIRRLPKVPWPFKGDGEQPGNSVNWLLEHTRMHPVSSHGPVYVKFALLVLSSGFLYCNTSLPHALLLASGSWEACEQSFQWSPRQKSHRVPWSSPRPLALDPLHPESSRPKFAWFFYCQCIHKGSCFPS